MAVYDSRGAGDIHVDQVLTNISVGYPNEEFVGHVLAPEVRVRKQSDKYYIHGREGWVLEPGSDVRAPGSVAMEIPGMEVSTDTYFAVEHALSIPVTDEERENADTPFSPDRDGTDLITSKLLLGRELAVKAMATDANNYPTTHKVTLSGSDQWDEYASADPMGDMKAGRNAIHAALFVQPNLTIIPYQVMSALEDHPDFIERIKYSQVGVVSEELIARLFRMPRIVVPGAGTNTAHMGQPESIAYIWGTDVLMAYVPARAGIKIPAYMYEFVWRFPGGQTQIVDRWRENKRVSDVIRVRRRYDHKFIAVDGNGDSLAGYLIKDAV